MVYKQIKALFILLGLTTNSFSEDYYIVRVGDTLSEIVQRETLPPPSLYGVNGRISQILQNNPQIKNPNTVYIGEKIDLRLKNSQSPTLMTEGAVKKNEKLIINKLNNNPIGNDKWRVGFFYGGRSFDHSQSGDLGKASVGLIPLNHLGLSSIYYYKKYKFSLNLETYSINLKASTSIIEERLSLIDLILGYKKTRFLLSLEEMPIFKNDNGVVLSSKMKVLKAKIGYEYKWKLPASKKTYISIDGIISYSIMATPSNTDIQDVSMFGFDIGLTSTLSRQIYTNQSFDIFAVMPIGVHYNQQKYKLTWGKSGTTTTTLLSGIFSLGFEFNF